MQPGQTPAPQQNPYEFIMDNRPAAPKRPSFGNTAGQRIAIVAGGAGALLLILMLFFALLSGGGDDTATFTRLAQQQEELARVSQLASNEDVAAQNTKNIAMSTYLTLASDKQELLATLGQNGVSINEKDIALGQNADTDTALESARAAGNYDATLFGILREQLTAYQASLEQAFAATQDPTLQEVLTAEYDGAALLLKQIDAANPVTS